MRGPMTRTEILNARQRRAALEGIELPRTSVARAQSSIEVPKSVRPGFGFVDGELEGQSRFEVARASRAAGTDPGSGRPKSRPVASNHNRAFHFRKSPRQR